MLIVSFLYEGVDRRGDGSRNLFRVHLFSVLGISALSQTDKWLKKAHLCTSTEVFADIARSWMSVVLLTHIFLFSSWWTVEIMSRYLRIISLKLSNWLCCCRSVATERGVSSFCRKQKQNYRKNWMSPSAVMASFCSYGLSLHAQKSSHGAKYKYPN